MLVHDYDDEQTLDEEENQSSSDAANELDDLEKVIFSSCTFVKKKKYSEVYHCFVI